MVLLLWFYVSSLAILVGAEMNAEIEHASPHGKDPGEKVPVSASASAPSRSACGRNVSSQSPMVQIDTQGGAAIASMGVGRESFAPPALHRTVVRTARTGGGEVF